MKLQFINKDNVGSNVWEFHFTRPDGFEYSAGQNCLFVLPHENADSKGEFRRMSLSSAPHETTLQFACRVFDDSTSFKKTLMSMHHGELIYFDGPFGNFLSFTNEQWAGKMVLCAAGIGITPFYSLLKYRKNVGLMSNDATLIYGARNQTDMGFAEEIANLCSDLKIHLILVFSDQQGEKSQKICPELLKRLGLLDKNITYGFCGPPEFGKGMRQAMIERGHSEESLHSSTFDDYTEVNY